MAKDVWIALRGLRRNPVFTLAALLSLALGIGGATALFSVVDALVLRPLPYEEPRSIVQLFLRGDSGRLRTGFTYDQFRRVRQSVRLYDGVGAYSFLPVALRTGERTGLVQSEIVAGDYFQVVRQQPSLGALPETLPPARAERAVLLGHDLWRNWFDGDAGVVGRTVWIEDLPFTVAGVMPAGFGGISPLIGADLWLPATARQELVYGDGSYRERDRDTRWLSAVARLGPEVTLERARAEAAAGGRWLREVPVGEERVARVEVFRYTGIGIPGQTRDSVAVWSGVFLGLIGLILLLACSNVANLLLVRAVQRRGDLGVRLALGARRGRLLRFLLVESVLLAFLGGALGCLLAYWCTRLFDLFLPRLPSHLTYTLNLSPDLRVLVLALAVSALCGVLFGLVPAWLATSSEVMDSVREGGVSATSARGSSRLQNLLVGVQVALCTALLVTAGLQVRSVQRSLAVSPGFAVEGGIAVTLDHAGGEGEEGAGVGAGELSAELGSLPGILGAAVVDRPPLSGRRSTVEVSREPGAGGEEATRSERLEVGPGFFRLFDVRVLAGRGFERGDTEAPSDAAIVSRSLAQRVWGGENPVGEFLLVGEEEERVRVVGVVEEVRYTTIRGDDAPMLYRPADLDGAVSTVLLRATGEPLPQLPTVRHRLSAEVPDRAVLDLATFQQLLDNATLPYRSLAILFGALAAAGLLLAVCGIFGVVSYAVRRRRREVAVRIVLGAGRGAVLRQVLARTLLAVAVGLGAGLVASGLMGFGLRSFLFQVDPFDPVTYVLVTFFLLLTGTAAAWWPGRQAVNTAPAEALRQE